MSQPATRIPQDARPALNPAELRLAVQRAASRRVRIQALRGFVRTVVLMAIDVALILGLWVALRTLRSALPGIAELFPRGVLGGSRFAVSVVVGLIAVGAYRDGDRWRGWGRVFRGVALGTALALWGDVWYGVIHIAVIRWAAGALSLGLIISMGRSVVSAVVYRWRVRTQRAESALLVGPEDDVVLSQGSLLFKPPSPFMLKATLPVERGATASDVAGQLLWALINSRPTTIVMAGHVRTSHWKQVVEIADVSGCRLLSMRGHGGDVLTAVHQTAYSGVPVSEITTPHLKYHEVRLKRAFDVLVSLFALVVLSPLLAIIALAVKASSPGPVLFKQERVGLGGRRFRILKFRSMRRDAEALRSKVAEKSVYGDGRLFKVRDDPRITPLGRFLRRMSLDELPQLVNVVKGEMSLVGPRPPVPREVILYEAHHYCRFDVKPGMTGPWQVSGRNEITDFEDVVLLEQEYLRNWSLTRDLRIVISTIPAVLRGNGAI